MANTPGTTMTMGLMTASSAESAFMALCEPDVALFMSGKPYAETGSRWVKGLVLLWDGKRVHHLLTGNPIRYYWVRSQWKRRYKALNG